MTDRTCGTCAWWDWPATVDGLKGEAGDRHAWIEAGCHYDNVGRIKNCDDWCRHHATTRGWDGEDRPLIDWASYSMQTKIEEGDPAKPLFAHVMDENARLKARCQEARLIFTDTLWVLGKDAPNIRRRIKEHLEASDDA